MPMALVVKLLLGIKEIINIANHLGFTEASDTIDINEPGILGDMVLTAGSSKSRNFLGGYNRVKNIHSDFLIESTHSCIELVNRIGINDDKWPIVSGVFNIINNNITDLDPIKVNLDKIKVNLKILQD